MSRKQKINVAGQGQPKHSTAWQVPCFKETQRIGSMKTYGPKNHEWQTRNCKGPQTISAANVGSIKDLISQKNVKTNDRLQGWYYVKNVSRQQHDKSRYNRIATGDSCFALLGARQHCVAKICNASQRANLHKLQSEPFTISSSVLWTHLRPETRAATSRVSGRKKTKVSRLVSWKQKRSYVGSAYRLRSLAVSGFSNLGSTMSLVLGLIL